MQRVALDGELLTVEGGGVVAEEGGVQLPSARVVEVCANGVKVRLPLDRGLEVVELLLLLRP